MLIAKVSVVLFGLLLYCSVFLASVFAFLLGFRILVNVLDLNNDAQAVSICEDKVFHPFVTLAFDMPLISV